MTISIKDNTTYGALNFNGTEAVVFNQGGAPSPIQQLTATVGSNALTVSLLPTVLEFRSATLSNGTVNTRVIASTISVVVSSGSTLGTVNAQQSRIVVLAIDNAGTVELAVSNIAGGVNLDETGLISTTAEGGAGGADSATVVYSTTARTNVPYRVVGYVGSTQATAGTWATAPSTIQGQGGQALAAMSSVGYSARNVVTGSRAIGVTYYNTSGKPQFVVVTANQNSSSSGVTTFNVNGVGEFSHYSASASSTITGVFGLVPPYCSYSVTTTNSITLTNWVE